MKNTFIQTSCFTFVMTTLLLAAAASAQVSSVRLNEVMAAPDWQCSGAMLVDGWVELYNPTDAGILLEDASLTDDALDPRKFVFPAGVSIPPTGFLVVDFAETSPGSVLNSGFRLRPNGGRIYLFSRLAEGGSLVDSLGYGLQTASYSIGRVPDGADFWTLTVPQAGASNAAAPLGSPLGLKINEWMSATTWGPDWFELYNSGSQPVALAGLGLTDSPWDGFKYRVPALSFIGTGPASGYAVFFADDNPAKGVNHVNFKLSAAGEMLGVFAPDGTVIDQMLYTEQPVDISQGRLPDGSTNIVLFTAQVGRWTASPGAPNPFPSILVIHSDPITLEFFVPANLACALDFQDNGGSPWQNLTNLVAATTDRTMQITDPAPTASQRIYRLRMQ